MQVGSACISLCSSGTLMMGLSRLTTVLCWRQVDEAAAKLKMEITSKPQHLDEIDRKILQLEMERLSLAKVGLPPQSV